MQREFKNFVIESRDQSKLVLGHKKGGLILRLVAGLFVFAALFVAFAIFMENKDEKIFGWIGAALFTGFAIATIVRTFLGNFSFTFDKDKQQFVKDSRFRKEPLVISYQDLREIRLVGGYLPSSRSKSMNYLCLIRGKSESKEHILFRLQGMVISHADAKKTYRAASELMDEILNFCHLPQDRESFEQTEKDLKF